MLVIQNVSGECLSGYPLPEESWSNLGVVKVLLHSWQAKLFTHMQQQKRFRRNQTVLKLLRKGKTSIV